jgi:hypothetical protein
LIYFEGAQHTPTVCCTLGRTASGVHATISAARVRARRCRHPARRRFLGRGLLLFFRITPRALREHDRRPGRPRGAWPDAGHEPGPSARQSRHAGGGWAGQPRSPCVTWICVIVLGAGQRAGKSRGVALSAARALSWRAVARVGQCNVAMYCLLLRCRVTAGEPFKAI